MLLRLEITDLAVISKAVFEPGTGLNVISGETGAGKSLLIDAIGLIMGNKSSRNLIRTGCDSAFVEAVFDISDSSDEELSELLSSGGLNSDEGLLIVSRKVGSDGKSIARINGRTVVIALLREIMSHLIDIHGQHDTQKIFNSDVHIDLLDSYGKGEIDNALSLYRERLEDYKKTVLEIRNLQAMGKTADERKEYLEFALKRIDDAAIRPGEDEELRIRHKNLKDNAALRDKILEASGCLFGDGDDDISQRLLQASKALKDADKDLSSRAESLSYDLQSIGEEVKALRDKMDIDPEEEEKVEARLGLIYELKSLYGPEIEDVLRFADNARSELSDLSDISGKLRELKKERSIKEKDLLEAASILSSIRHAKGDLLCDAIKAGLKDLNMPDASFNVSFEERSRDRFFSSKGTENVTFMFSANPGEEPRDLSKTASGGEASRIMLAIKDILSEADKTPTLIFDEIDTGVSGNAAYAIAKKLLSISRCHQVLCVTHTPQLAAAADDNFLISKAVSDGRTDVSVTKLQNDGKIGEVSRLMSGGEVEGSLQVSENLIKSIRG